MMTHGEAAALPLGRRPLGRRPLETRPLETRPLEKRPRWVEAHEALSRLARERAALDAEEGLWLLSALRSAAHVHLGFGSFAQYVERLFGYRPRTTQEKLRVAEALEGLPRMRAALASGALGWCAVRELTRVVVPATEQAWLEAAQGKTLRDLEALVADKAAGDAPDAPAGAAARRHVLRFEVDADTFATFHEAMQHLERAAGGRMDHDALLLAMARYVLGGPADDGRSSYQISLHVCSACGRGQQVASGERIAVGAAVVEMAACDAQQLGALLASAGAEHAANENGTPPSPAAPESAEAPIDIDPGTAGRCPNHAHVGVSNHEPSAAPQHVGNHEPNAAHAHVGNHEPNAAHAHVGNHEPNAAHAHVGNHEPSGAHAALPRARQSIPPALRRAVLQRDQRRCQVPGCTHTTYVDVHHLQRRADGGPNVPDNLLTLCSAHHRATHRGELLIERGSHGGLAFRHADGSAYGDSPAPARVDAQSKVFSALRQLGFRELEVKAVMAELRADVALAQATVQLLLREALCRIRRAR